ncbi:PQQ-dependent sugar dehydrogenase [Chitinophaga sp. CF418]|uniref:PQQ-dependent sugar dehydrogenase n=1 Tax=Chitinophaga sp. CF418 TaxID=1855287 RepID=UPI0009245F89|nr:PQQ-dependent sugar dehydrogenase [Chitinophaga sp. CF418]SHN33736.1 Glucose/arabinose dehydrogenase, beta-propeller fold [Chitinophaga sp. CF418]
MRDILICCLTGLSIIPSLSFLKESHDPSPPPAGFIVDTIVKDMVVPWDINFLPDQSMIFTERPGRVRLYRNRQLLSKTVLTLTDIEAKGKMGLLGMCLHPAFNSNKFIYLSYNYRRGDNAFLRVARYTFNRDSLTDPKVIIENIPASFNHTGSRLVFGPDKKLYITTGDADRPILAQDLKALNGKILRLNEDGSIPPDNPFFKSDTARREIWTYGHRNPQGLAFQPGTGLLYDSEHGPNDGDEINFIEKGKNYGWPIIHHREQAADMNSPTLEFTPSIGPAKALFYTGNAFPELKDHLLVGCMRGEAILNISFAQNKIAGHEFLLKNKYGRIRALAQGPDGFIYLSTSMIDPPENDARPGNERSFDLILRLRPSADTRQLADAKTSKTFRELCANCHGENLPESKIAQDLTDDKWIYGGSKNEIIHTIRHGVVNKGMPSWEGVINDNEIGKMADYILSFNNK